MSMTPEMSVSCGSGQILRVAARLEQEQAMGDNDAGEALRTIPLGSRSIVVGEQFPYGIVNRPKDKRPPGSRSR
jgi:hypothetical protein